MSHLAQSLLHFYTASPRYGAAGTSRETIVITDDPEPFDDACKVVPSFLGIPTLASLCTPDAFGDLPWLSSGHVEYGLKSAVEDAARKTGRRFAQAMGQLSWTERDDERGPAKQIADQVARMQDDKKLFFWVINASPSSSRGSHWMVVVVSLPRLFRQLDEAEDDEQIAIQFFDSMGGRLPTSAREFVVRLLRTELASVIRVRHDLVWIHRITDRPLDQPRRAVQPAGDGVQCGVWCIWYVHSRLLMGVDELSSFSMPPGQEDLESQLAFRRLYFTDDPVPRNMYRPKRPREVVEIED